MNNELGSIKISDDVLSACAAKAALDTQGVYSLAPADFTDTISESILGKVSGSRGIKLSQGDGEIKADIYIIVSAGVKIPAVAWNIQENVKKNLEEFSGYKVSCVNIHVQGIHFEKSEKEKSGPARQEKGKQ